MKYQATRLVDAVAWLPMAADKRKQMQSVKDNKRLDEKDRTAKVTELQTELTDLDRLTAARDAMSSVNKAVP